MTLYMKVFKNCRSLLCNIQFYFTL